MSLLISKEGNLFKVLRKGFPVGGLIACVTVFLSMYHPNYRWLQEAGSLAVIFFLIGNLVLIYWPKETRPRLDDDGQGGGPQ